MASTAHKKTTMNLPTWPATSPATSHRPEHRPADADRLPPSSEGTRPGGRGRGRGSVGAADNTADRQTRCADVVAAPSPQRRPAAHQRTHPRRTQGGRKRSALRLPGQRSGRSGGAQTVSFATCPHSRPPSVRTCCFCRALTSPVMSPSRPSSVSLRMVHSSSSRRDSSRAPQLSELLSTRFLPRDSHAVSCRHGNMQTHYSQLPNRNIHTVSYHHRPTHDCEPTPGRPLCVSSGSLAVRSARQRWSAAAVYTEFCSPSPRRSAGRRYR